MTILNKTKILVGVSDETKDSLITLLIEQAESEFLQITNQTERPEAADNVIVDMVVVKYNLLGEEGISSTSYSGASESYENYSPQLKAAINRYKRVKII